MSGLAQFVWVLEMETETPSEIYEILAKDEEVLATYTTYRGVAVFTNKRLMVRDSLAKVGKKKETYSLPYHSINMFSVEDTNLVDVEYRIEFWTKIGHVKINLKRGVDVDKIGRILAEYVL